MATRIGVDVGGTFTDLIYYDDETGEIRVDKEPTTPASPELGVIAAVEKTLGGGELDRAGYFLHGTTVGLTRSSRVPAQPSGSSARRGSATSSRPAAATATSPTTCSGAPRRRSSRAGSGSRSRSGSGPTARCTSPSRQTTSDGAAEVFAAEGVTAVAIAFMNAYANPEHELAAESALRDAGFDGRDLRSHTRSPASTASTSGRRRPSSTRTCAVGMASYLRRLEDGLGDAGFSGSLLVTRSGGGAMTFAEAERRPFETIMSGPGGRRRGRGRAGTDPRACRT